MEMVRNCGWQGYVVVFLATLGLVVAISALAVATLAKRFGVAMAVVSIVVTLTIPAMGLVGTMMGQRVTDAALSGVSEGAMRERIRQQGHYEAAQCTSLGAFGAILPGLMSMGALLIAIVRRASRKPDDAELERPN